MSHSNAMLALPEALADGVNCQLYDRGQFGVVYSADHPSGREMAVKAVQKDGDGYDREIRAYRTIGDARDKHDAIAKHFPLIYTIDEKSHDQYSFIAMERLTDEGPYADLVKDLFAGSEYLLCSGDSISLATTSNRVRHHSHWFVDIVNRSGHRKTLRYRRSDSCI